LIPTSKVPYWYKTHQTTMKVPNHVLDTLHSTLMDDYGFQEALMRVTLDIASDYTDDEEDAQDLAMELFSRVSVS